MLDKTVRNLEALQLGTGEFSFAPSATSLAEARSIGFLDFGNIQAIGFKPELDKVDHEGSYRGVRRIDKTFGTKASLEYNLKCDEWDREKLKLALMGSNATNITQSAQTLATGDTLAFATTAATINRWYDLLLSGEQVRELTACFIGKSAAVAATVDASLDKLTATAHGLTDGTPVVLRASAAPTGLSLGTIYYVRDSATNDFKLAATSGGAAIDITSTGTAVTFAPVLVEDTDYVVDAKIGRVRFLTAQSQNRFPILTASAITSGGAANLLGFTPLQSLIQSGYGRLALFDDTHPNKLVFLHENFSCQVFLDSTGDVDGKSVPEISLRVRITSEVGTCYSAE